MANPYSMEDLLKFLDHAGARGLMPATTAGALAVATRNVLAVLSDQERKDLSRQDIASVVKRFNNKRAKDFNPSSLKEYGRRVNRAVDLFLKWREDPANFTVKTRATKPSRKRESNQETMEASDGAEGTPEAIGSSRAATYQSAIPVRPGLVITLGNVPYDLTKVEAERLASFVRMLAINA
jgi:hypothetical protein